MALTKAISWLPTPCSYIPKGGPPYGWKNWGIFAVGRTGRRGLWVSSNLGQFLAPRPQGPEPRGGRVPLIVGCRCPAGVQGLRGHSPGDRGRLGPERAPGKARGLDLQAAVASSGSCHGAWSRFPGPRFTAGEHLWQTPQAGGRRFLHRQGVRALG